MLLRVERGEERVTTSPMVVFETVFILEKSYGTPRAIINERMQALISMRGLRLTNKRLYYQALDTYASTKISFADAYNAAFMRTSGLSEIYSWDFDFDRLEGISRVEPEATVVG